jgi:hypothetical protein
MSNLDTARSLAAAIEETPDNYRALRELRSILGHLDDPARRGVHLIDVMQGTGVIDLPRLRNTLQEVKP